MESLSKFYNINEGNFISETDLTGMSTIVLYSLLPRQSDSAKTITMKVDLYEELRKIYSTNAICEQTLDQALNDLNTSVEKQLEKHQVIIQN